MLVYHIIAFSVGVILDFIIGDPYWMPHPIRLIGRLISILDKRLMDKQLMNECRDERKERSLGYITAFVVIASTLVATALIIIVGYSINMYFGIVVEAILTCYILAAKSLRRESMKVYYCLKDGDIKRARAAVAMIVGRDTDSLDESGIAKAAVETVAENTSDGVIAPLIYTCIGGPVLGMVYKAINTMDSMIGYHNDRYENFGGPAARLDDIVNFIPARISAFFMILVSMVLGKSYSTMDGIRIFRRDRFNHKSPNSAQTESVCAGVLRVRLAGDASYFGHIVKKPFIGDDIKPICPEDIKKVNKLMYGSAFLAIIVCEIIMMVLVL